MFGSSHLLLNSLLGMNLLEEDRVMRLGVLYHGGQHALVRFNQPGLAGLLVSDGEESFVIFLSPAARDTPVLHLIRKQLQVQFGLGV